MTATITSLIPRSGKLRVSRWVGKVDKQIAKEIYSDYWNAIAPKTDEDRFWFWVFSYLTVQQSWQATVKAFEHVRPLGMNFKPSQLHRALQKSHTGLYDKYKGIVQFRDLYEICPMLPAEGQGLRQTRDQLVKVLRGTGIGPAKVSLALSMINPDQDEIICIDRHIRRWYGVEDGVNLSDRLYREIEYHFVNACVKHGLHPGMVREMYWDSVQGFGNTRYWSHVLEPHDASIVFSTPPQESNTRKSARYSRKQAARRTIAAVDSQAKDQPEIRRDQESIKVVLAKYQRLVGTHSGDVSVPTGQTA